MMRDARATRNIRRASRRIAGELTSRLLIAAMLSPVVAGALGWPVQTPLNVPLTLHVALLICVVLVIRSDSRHRREARDAFSLASWGLLPVLAVAFASLLQARANVFYSARAMMEGMATLLILEVGLRALRRRALVGGMRIGVPSIPNTHLPVAGSEWTGSLWLTRAPTIRLADRLAAVVGWAILASWVLIALGHRHVVGPLLLLAGVLEAFALLALIPDALGGSSLLSGSNTDRIRALTHREHRVMVRAPRPPRSPQRLSLYRRFACHLADLRHRGRLPTAH